ncbi:MAG: ABC transporter ATP-binding protein [Pseudomonadota bacterium]
MEAENPGLTVTGLTRRFGQRAVVDEVSFAVEPGSVTCLLGPSGCGKSTCLRIIAGVDRQDAGRVAVDGVTLSEGAIHLPPEARNIGLMFQDFALFPHLTVAENVAFGLGGSKAEKGARVDDLLARVRLESFAKAYPHEISGGEQQRVALARAVAARPRVMLMDEPFSGLDNRLRDGIRDETLDVLKEFGTAVLLVTHEPAEAMRMADRIALMRDGRIVQEGAPVDLFHAPVDKAAASFFSDINVVRSTMENGHAATPLGTFTADGVTGRHAVDVVVRPQHLHVALDPPGEGAFVPGNVRRSRFIGQESLIEVETEHGRMMASVRDVNLPDAGTVVWLSVDPSHALVFRADD